MNPVLEAPLEMFESLAALRLPPRRDRRLQALMERNNEGSISPEESEELEDLVEFTQTLSLLRAQALSVLGRRPE